MNVLASAIRAKMDAWDLQELELSYAPPYSSAKDPVNMAGFVTVSYTHLGFPVIPGILFGSPP